MATRSLSGCTPRRKRRQNLLSSVVHGRSVLVFDLSPTGQARTNCMALVVIRNFFPEHANKFGAFGTRPDEAHIAAQNVDQLRQLVQPKLPQYPADTSDALIIRSRPHRFAFFSIFSHGAELQDGKSAAMESDALLTE